MGWIFQRENQTLNYNVKQYTGSNVKTNMLFKQFYLRYRHEHSIILLQNDKSQVMYDDNIEFHSTSTSQKKKPEKCV